MKQTLTLSHDTWMSLSLQQQAEQRAKYDVVVEPVYAQADEVAEVAKDGEVMAKNSGGPAFPVTITNQSRTPAPGFNNDEVPGGASTIYGGMTLRDYFAAKALPAAMTICWADIGYPPVDGLRDMQQNARLAYQMADAMLAEREK